MSGTPTPHLVIPADPKRVLISLSLVMVAVAFLAVAFLAVGAWKVAIEVASARQAIELNTRAVSSLQATIEDEVLKRTEFEVFVKRLRDLNPGMRWQD